MLKIFQKKVVSETDSLVVPEVKVQGGGEAVILPLGQLQQNLAASAHILSLCPCIMWLPDFLSDEECEHLKSLAQENMNPSMIYDESTGAATQQQTRTSRSRFLSVGHDMTIKIIEARIASLARLPVEYGELLQLLNYQVGQEYKPHHDYYDINIPAYVPHIAECGQRAITVLMYLNDVEEGGETIFPLLNLNIHPQRRGALLFFNLHSNGIPDPNTLHGSAPVLAGEKYVATKWIRNQVYPKSQI